MSFNKILMNNIFYKDKVVWVTGASQGIGAALCKELSALGAHLILSARDTRALEELKTHLERPEKCTV
ncbi:MAG: SDR family NAD(P)-dependent oxidoreductase, partial [Saprospiraceae bacterium]